jgi:hypothetical protein
MGKEQTTIDLWTQLTGRQRVLQFHLGNVPMMNLSWNELDEKQIREVAKCYPVACQEELCLIRELCGETVTRVSHLLAGDRHCSYFVEEGGGSKRPEESPARSERDRLS